MDGQFERTITLQAVLKHIDGGGWCDLVFVKANRKQGTAGAFGSLVRCVKSTNEATPRPVTAVAPEANAIPSKQSRDPRHYYNATRNMYQPADRKMRKIHIRLIVKFNGLRVL